MDFIQIVTLALIQGLTEFLPISSSAHLILFPKLMGWSDQGLAFDVAVHVGTLCAVILFFRRELILMLQDWLQCIFKRKNTSNSFLAWAVIFGTIPLGLTGLAIKDFVETIMRSDIGPVIIAAATIIFGLLLWWADRHAKQNRTELQLRISDVVIIGCAQALALISGTSRSGITITAALMLGLTRQGAARFSFLLSIPAILAPGLLKTLDLIKLNNNPELMTQTSSQSITLVWGDLLLGVVISALSAYICIHYFLKLLEKMGMLPFVIYRLVLGFILLIIFLPAIFI